MVHMARNDKRSQTDISSIISLYKLPLQPMVVRLGLCLGLKAKILPLTLKLAALTLALQPTALTLLCMALAFYLVVSFTSLCVFFSSYAGTPQIHLLPPDSKAR